MLFLASCPGFPGTFLSCHFLMNSSVFHQTSDFLYMLLLTVCPHLNSIPLILSRRPLRGMYTRLQIFNFSYLPRPCRRILKPAPWLWAFLKGGEKAVFPVPFGGFNIGGQDGISPQNEKKSLTEYS